MNWLTIASVWKLKNVYCNWSEHWKYLNIQISNCWNIIKTFLCSVLLTQYVFCSERVRVRVRPSEEQSTGSRPNGWNGDYGSASRFDGWLISSIQFPSYGMGWPPALPTIVMMPSHRARLEGILLSRLYIAFSSPSAAPIHRLSHKKVDAWLQKNCLAPGKTRSKFYSGSVEQEESLKREKRRSLTKASNKKGDCKYQSFTVWTQLVRYTRPEINIH